jgi:Ca-activated chloride channel homolog
VIRIVAAIAVSVVLAIAVLTGRDGWPEVWTTPDQRGAWALSHGRFAEAADVFTDPVWRGVAQMRAGQFSAATQSFAASDTAEAHYDRGNALVMLGQYPEAVAQYAAALVRRPGWPDAIANQALAQIRADRFAQLQGEDADQQKAAADERYRRDRQRDDSTPSTPSDAVTMSDDAIRALWLRRVQTRPADFLRTRFAYQLEQAKP